MADFQEMLDFPPAPKLDVFGKLDPAKATPAETRGQQVFLGKGECASCHQPPFYTDNLMHNLQTERFFKPVMINNMMAVGDGLIKTFALRGVKDNPPYFHDERLLTLGGHGRVLQPDPRHKARATGETGPGGFSARPLDRPTHNASARPAPGPGTLPQGGCARRIFPRENLGEAGGNGPGPSWRD